MLYAQNMFDKLQIEDVMLCVDCPKFARGYIAYFGTKTRSTLKHAPRFSSRRNSVWMPACYDHTNTLCLAHSVSVIGHRLRDTLQDWFFSNVDGTIVDDCATSNSSQPCNPFCHAYQCRDM